MIAEYKNDKVALLSALEQADANLHAHVATYAVIETEDPAMPFEICLVHDCGNEDDASRLLNERLFDRAFLDFGYKEVRGEDNLEGVVYAPIEELFTDKVCIGVAPRSMFDDDLSRVRMARGAEEEEVEETDDVMRFVHFLKAIDGRVIDGAPARTLAAEDVAQVCGLLFKYVTGTDGSAQCVVAFQRTQRMWFSKSRATCSLTVPKASRKRLRAALSAWGRPSTSCSSATMSSSATCARSRYCSSSTSS